MMKEESRILAYALGNYYGVFATYRRNFIEEFLILRLPVLNEYRFLEKNLRTFNEITYVLPCNSSGYVPSLFPGFKVINGGDRLVYGGIYCKIIKTVLCMLDKRGLINQPSTEHVIELGEKCLL
ncbi:MAG: hypothetical protein QW211_00795 [Desulfurococcaceae archaeon]